MTQTGFSRPSQENARRDIDAGAQAAALELEHAINDIPGLLASMLVELGKNGIRTVEDLAACATDDLLGWTECRGNEITEHPGILQDILVSRKQCDSIILHARIRVGWIEAAVLTA